MTISATFPQPLVRPKPPLKLERPPEIKKINSGLLDDFAKNQSKWVLQLGLNGQLKIEPLQVSTQFSTDPPVFFSRGHGNALGIWEFARIRKIFHGDAALIHVDTHHDLTSGRVHVDMGCNLQAAIDRFEAQAAFILPAMYHGLVSEYYWILPPWVNSENLPEHLREYSLSLSHRFPAQIKIASRINYHYGDMPPSLVAVDAADKIVFDEVCKVYENEDVVVSTKLFDLHYKFLESLPAINLSGRPVILDIDLDWLGLIYQDPPDVESRVKLLMRSIQRSNWRPSLINFALSGSYRDSNPGYTHPAILTERNLAYIVASMFNLSFA